MQRGTFVTILTVAGVIIGIALILVGGLVGWVLVPKMVERKVKMETRLIEGSETWEKWREVGYPIQLKFYIFNITNPEALGTNEKLNFEECGPYVYDETRAKVNVSVDEEEGTVTYREVKHYFFNEQASKGREDDLFNIPDVPFISIAHTAQATLEGQDLENAQYLITFLAVYKQGKVIRESVKAREILFEGWELPSLYVLIPSEQLPSDFEGFRFGFYRHKNGSDDGEYVVKSGEEDSAEFGKIVSWNGMEKLPWWNYRGLDVNSSEQYCNEINGSDGSMYPPFITKNSVLRVYSSEICRSIYFTYDDEIFVHGIPAYKFTIPSELFASPDSRKDNACFCQMQSSKLAHQCSAGVIRIFGCQNGAPIVTSNPHFLDGGDELFEPIQIEPPVREFHETYVVVEPTSGMLLRARKKVQISIEVQRIPKMQIFEDLDFSNFTKSPSIILPIFWAEESVELGKEDADVLYDRLIAPQKTVAITRWVVIAIGIASVLVSGVILAWQFGK